MLNSPFVQGMKVRSVLVIVIPSVFLRQTRIVLESLTVLVISRDADYIQRSDMEDLIVERMLPTGYSTWLCLRIR